MSAVAKILNSMEPISLAEMDGVRLMNRTDTKYVFNREELLLLLEQVQHDYRVLHVEGQYLSPYKTLYFDSPDQRFFVQHHNGKLNRHKIRMRCYESSGVSFLEVKAKNNKGRTDKRRMPIDGIEQAFSPEATAFIRSALKQPFDLRPKLWTLFSRVTLVHRHAAERVTLDTKLEFSFEDKSHRLDGIVIAEVKQERDNRRSPLREQLRQQGIRPLRISKYCIGSLLLNPSLKANRFKSKLRAIDQICLTDAEA